MKRNISRLTSYGILGTALSSFLSCSTAESLEVTKSSETNIPIEQCVFECDIEPDELPVCESNPNIQQLIDKYGLNLDDVISLGAIAMIEGSGNIEEHGAIMRVAYNRANDSKRRFNGGTIREIITACDWNCGDSYHSKIKRALKRVQQKDNEKYLVYAIDFLIGQGLIADGAKLNDCRSGFIHPATRERLYSTKKNPYWANKDPKVIGKGLFAVPLNPCPEYPRRR